MIKYYCPNCGSSHVELFQEGDPKYVLLYGKCKDCEYYFNIVKQM